MGQDSDTQQQQLTHDIEETRQDLGHHVDALTDKVSPGRIVERRVDRAKGGFSRVKERVMGSAHDAKESMRSSGSGGSGISDTASSTLEGARDQARGNPLAAGVIAFGAGWLLSSVLPASDAEANAAQKLEETAKDKGQPLMEQAQQAGREIGDNMKDKASEAADEVKLTAQESKERVTQEGRSSAEHVRDEARPS